MVRTYIGIDNGVTGSVAVLRDNPVYFKMPVRTEQSYTKKKGNITRIRHADLRRMLSIATVDSNDVRVFLERPYVNPTGIKATVSAVRALEATLIVLEMLGFSYQYVDSREWQKVMLPSGLKGKELKDASRDVGIRLFPDLEEDIFKQKDADGLLIAEWARRAGL